MLTVLFTISISYTNQLNNSEPTRMPLSEKQVVDHIRDIQARLRRKARMTPFTDDKWDRVPEKGGVYAIWKAKKGLCPVYVGETANLAERFNDLKHWRNHTFTRKIKNGFSKPDSIRSHITENYFISFVVVSLGRIEAEEHIIHTWDTFNDFNKPSPRYLRTKGLELVEV